MIAAAIPEVGRKLVVSTLSTISQLMNGNLECESLDPRIMSTFDHRAYDREARKHRKSKCSFSIQQIND